MIKDINKPSTALIENLILGFDHYLPEIKVKDLENKENLTFIQCTELRSINIAYVKPASNIFCLFNDKE